MLTGVIGLALNLLLGVGKLVVGVISGSVSVITDAANNLSDAGSSLVTISSFSLSSKKADRAHPFGHGRYEYIAGFIIGVVIIMVGFEFAVTSVKKIITPETVAYTPIMMAVLGISVAVKLFMGVFYKVREKKLKSKTLGAAAFDSFSDACVTLTVIIAILLNRVIAYPLEGVVGLLVSVIIIVGGGKILLDTIKPLLGGNVDDDTVREITCMVREGECISGTHDLEVHDYGPGRVFASVHAEFEKDLTITEAHVIIDELEKTAKSRFGIELVIHCDPVVTVDKKVAKLRSVVKEAAKMFPGVGVHEVHADYENKTVSYHAVIPESLDKDADRIIEKISMAADEVMPGFVTKCQRDVDVGENTAASQCSCEKGEQK